MKIFAVNTIVHRDHLPVAFSIGDEVPEWALSLVGSHCLAAETVDDFEDSESDSETADDQDESEPDADEAEGSAQEPTTATDSEPLDFTKPAPVKRTRQRKAE